MISIYFACFFQCCWERETRLPTATVVGCALKRKKTYLRFSETASERRLCRSLSFRRLASKSLQLILFDRFGVLVKHTDCYRFKPTKYILKYTGGPHINKHPCVNEVKLILGGKSKATRCIMTENPSVKVARLFSSNVDIMHCDVIAGTKSTF